MFRPRFFGCLITRIISFVVVAGFLVLSSRVERASAGYSGRLDSVSSNSPISVGNSLSFTTGVTNTGTEAWLWWSNPAWQVELDNASWSPPWSYIAYYVWHDVAAGASDTYSGSLSSANLPTSPGNYSVRVMTAYYDDWGSAYWMTDTPPLSLNFTMVVNTPPIADADGPYMQDDWSYGATPSDTTVVLDATGSSDLPSDPLTYEWDLTYNGATFSPTAGVTGPTPTLTLQSLLDLGYFEGETADIAVRVSDFQYSDVASTTLFVPEPSTIALLATGVASLLFMAWRRRRRVSVV